MASRRWAAILLFLTLVAANASAQKPSLDVLCLILPGAGVSSALQQVVTDAVLVQLSRRKLDARLVDPAASPVPTLSAALALARQDGAQILVYGTSAATGSDLSLSLQAYDPGSRRHFDPATEKGPIDLTVDSLVSRALATALLGVTFTPKPAAPAAVPESVAELPAQPTVEEGSIPISGAAAQQGRAPTDEARLDPAPPALAQPLPPAPPSANVPQGDPVAGGAAASVRVTPASPRTSTARANVPWFDGKTSEFGVYTGFAPLITTGRAAAYAQIGWAALVSADLTFNLWSGSLGVGILSGACWLDARGLASGARIVTIPAGLDLRFTLERAEIPWLALHLSGGPAALQVTTTWGGDLTKATAYLLAGLVMDLPFTSNFGMTLEANYLVFFESVSLPIMGFVPEVSFHVRL